MNLLLDTHCLLWLLTDSPVLDERARRAITGAEAVWFSEASRHAHDDPFDRMLYAQAKVAGWKLLSMDRTLRSFGTVILKP